MLLSPGREAVQSTHKARPPETGKPQAMHSPIWPRSTGAVATPPTSSTGWGISVGAGNGLPGGSGASGGMNRGSPGGPASPKAATISALRAASAWSRAVWTISPRRSKAAISRSSKACAFPDSSSKTPITSCSRGRGITSADTMPNAWQISRLTRGSVARSWQCRSWRVRTHSPERPELTSKRAPSFGADGPALARQTICSPCRNPMAAPDAPVMDWALSASNCRVASRSSFAISESDRPPSSPGKRKASPRASPVGEGSPAALSREAGRSDIATTFSSKMEDGSI